MHHGLSARATVRQCQLRGGGQKGGEDLDQKQAKEILGKQLELLAEVSKKTSKPEVLPELSVAMCEIADRLEEICDPLIHREET